MICASVRAPTLAMLLTSASISSSASASCVARLQQSDVRCAYSHPSGSISSVGRGLSSCRMVLGNCSSISRLTRTTAASRVGKMIAAICVCERPSGLEAWIAMGGSWRLFTTGESCRKPLFHMACQLTSRLKSVRIQKRSYWYTLNSLSLCFLPITPIPELTSKYLAPSI